MAAATCLCTTGCGRCGSTRLAPVLLLQVVDRGHTPPAETAAMFPTVPRGHQGKHSLTAGAVSRLFSRVDSSVMFLHGSG